MNITPVIMSGGSGSRLWPISDDVRAKQFLALTSDQSMLQETVRRLSNNIFNDQFLVVSNQDQVDLIHKNIPSEKCIIIGEPCRRNTAAAATAAALYILEENPNDDIILLAPSDHVISKTTAFYHAVQQAKVYVEKGFIVTFGIHPQSAETGYGYIKRGRNLEQNIFKIDRFREKPNTEKAKKYLESGLYDWNAGIFMFSAKTFLKEMKTFAPNILQAVTKAYQSSARSHNYLKLNETAFKQSPSISIDYAVMEKTDKAVVVSCDIGWSDLGSYKSLFEVRKHLNMNTLETDTKTINASDCLVISDGPQVNIIGLDNIGVIVDRGRILILDLEQSQHVKSLTNT